MADANGSIYLWSAQGTLTATLSNGTRDNDRVAVNPDGGLVAVGSNGGSTYLWDVAAGKANPTSTSSLHDPGGKNVYGVAFSPDGKLLAAATRMAASTCGTWPPASTPPRSRIRAARACMTSRSARTGNCWPPPTCRAAPATAWCTCGTCPRARWPGSWSRSTTPSSPTSRSPRTAASWRPGHHRQRQFLELATGKYVQTLSDPLGKSIIGVAFSPSGNLLACTDTAGDAYIWNTAWLSG